jgi:hypothetical protein
MKSNKELYQLLLTDLAVRHDNIYIGSSYGGNCSQLYFLITHKVSMAFKDDTSLPTLGIFTETSDGTIEWTIPIFAIKSPAKGNVQELNALRESLKSLWENHPDKIEVSESLMKDIDFLRQIPNQTPEVISLIEATSLAQNIDNQLQFLPKELTEDDWGDEKFHNKLSESEAGIEIKLSFKKLLQLPPFASLFATRTVLGIEKIVLFWLETWAFSKADFDSRYNINAN